MNKGIPGATDDLRNKPFYHGTRAELRPGDLIEPGDSQDVGDQDIATYVYLTHNLDEVILDGELAAGEGPSSMIFIALGSAHKTAILACRAGGSIKPGGKPQDRNQI